MAISGPQWCIEGLQEAADALLLDNATPEDKEIFLFSNDATVTDASVNADLTAITTNGGEKVTLTKATWTAATAADPVASIYNSGTGIVWTITGALTIYGWGIRGAVSTKLYCAENFGVNTVANGNTVTFEPTTLNFDIPE